ncbi:uncharacterized protein LOC125515328 [Triticum urartu]|uniref:uncharacterized protein LOC125515328 n=1 Tax=Triticum urartu TaxID=4572 RepID=UPI0020435C47|nr:uncharacterized protein LOC125515328 [Triticum urartu]
MSHPPIAAAATPPNPPRNPPDPVPPETNRSLHLLGVPSCPTTASAQILLEPELLCPRPLPRSCPSRSARPRLLALPFATPVTTGTTSSAAPRLLNHLASLPHQLRCRQQHPCQASSCSPLVQELHEKRSSSSSFPQQSLDLATLVCSGVRLLSPRDSQILPNSYRCR